MTNERACANDDDRRIAPVSAWENEAVHGHALCAEMFVREHIELTQSLRDRQAAYLDSLPSDPTDAIDAALKLMHPDGESYSDGIEEALHLSYALEALVKEGDLDTGGRSRDATLYVAFQLSYAMHRATRQLDLIAHILANPGRLEREGGVV